MMSFNGKKIFEMLQLTSEATSALVCETPLLFFAATACLSELIRLFFAARCVPLPLPVPSALGSFQPLAFLGIKLKSLKLKIKLKNLQCFEIKF